MSAGGGKSGSLFGGLRLSSDSLRSLYICIAYGASSTIISLVFKGLLSSYNYNGKFILLTLQQAVSLLFCVYAKRFLAGRLGFDVPDVKREVLVDSIWPGILNVANIVVGWAGMALVSVPLFLCIRRTATAMCARECARAPSGSVHTPHPCRPTPAPPPLPAPAITQGAPHRVPHSRKGRERADAAERLSHSRRRRHRGLGSRVGRTHE